MIRELDISTKERYLDWVQEWKGYWKAIVSEIKFYKQQRYSFRKHARWNLTQARKNPQNVETYKRNADRYFRLMNQMDYQRDRLRFRARVLHELRMHGKELSVEAKEEHSTVGT